MHQAKVLRKLLRSKKLLIVPGVYDALTSKIAQYCGFRAIYMTGGGTAASWGYPDIGLLTMNEMLENLRRICDSVELPVIADADTGYGGYANVYRTVREYEKAGAAAIQLEDQTWPKRSGHMTGKQVIDAKEMVGKVKAAVDARTHPETVLIIRTDANAVHGFEEAVRRGQMYAEAGADILFIETLSTEEQLRKIPPLFSKPCLINMAFLWQKRNLKELEEMGYAIAIYPVVTLQGAIDGAFRMCKALSEKGRPLEVVNTDFEFDQLNKLLGLDRYKELENKVM
jgi:2-methylisocitrate lyase-like PEP mutase family enzyme